MFKSLWSHGILRRFFFEYMTFILHPDRSNRDIAFVFVTDGEVASSPLEFAQDSDTSDDVKSLFALLSTEFVIREIPSCEKDKESISFTEGQDSSSYAHQ